MYIYIYINIGMESPLSSQTQEQAYPWGRPVLGQPTEGSIVLHRASIGNL